MNILKKIFSVVLFSAVCTIFLSSCTEDEEAQDKKSLKLIEREVTWVKEKPVASTQEEALAQKKDTSRDIEPIEILAQRLKKETAGTPVTDRATCLAQVVVQDKIRTEVQVRGGLWGWFEKNPDIKKYSDRGMQLDSSINKLVFALGRLCQTAEGAPMNNHARRILRDLQEKGEDRVRKELVLQGRAPEDIDIWINFARASDAIKDRNLNYSELGTLINQAATLTHFYAELSNRQVDTNNAENSQASAQTLLTVLKDLLENNSHVTMALKEDNRVPYESPAEM
ncbi:MAG: hypothetical protein COV66_02635 [Nitrospinae bacterium CG11_big_fil_rev_8_21_14_0_20_45_15]|nr:MAG: hypothetical protein COV66_02635 [Nitrospinae bacterium CG11_big_fil_rev_8_21_14_0_20_45_15]